MQDFKTKEKADGSQDTGRLLSSKWLSEFPLFNFTKQYTLEKGYTIPPLPKVQATSKLKAPEEFQYTSEQGCTNFLPLPKKSISHLKTEGAR